MTTPCPQLLPSPHLVSSYVVELIPQIRSTAERTARRYGHPDPSELLSVGLLAACELAPRFDPSRGASFAAFIRLRVEGSMIEVCRESRRWVPFDPSEHDCATPSAEEEYSLAEERERDAQALASLHQLELSERDRRFVGVVVAQQGSVAAASRVVGIAYQTAYSLWRRIAAKARAVQTWPEEVRARAIGRPSPRKLALPTSTS
jgi:DNA-directed RNA polymerase specialized sigma subunit